MKTLLNEIRHNPLLWLLVFVFLPKPIRTYVLGHELTHAIWALLMGARVSGLTVRKAGGQVRTSKTNWAITLAPYFFPFYAVLFMTGFFIAHAIWDLTPYFWILFELLSLFFFSVRREREHTHFKGAERRTCQFLVFGFVSLFCPCSMSVFCLWLAFFFCICVILASVWT